MQPDTLNGLAWFGLFFCGLVISHKETMSQESTLSLPDSNWNPTWPRHIHPRSANPQFPAAPCSSNSISWHVYYSAKADEILGFWQTCGDTGWEISSIATSQTTHAIVSENDCLRKILVLHLSVFSKSVHGTVLHWTQNDYSRDKGFYWYSLKKY